MVKVINHPSNLNFFIVNDVPYEKGNYELFITDKLRESNLPDDLREETARVGIRHINKLETIQNAVAVKVYLDSADVPYNDFTALITDLKSIISGGGAPVTIDLTPVVDKLEEIRVINETDAITESISSMAKYVDPDGNIVAYGSVIRDQITGTSAPVFYDTNLQEITVLPTGSTIASGKDFETVSIKFQDISDNSIRYIRVSLINTANPSAATSTLWFNESGTIITAPTNVESVTEHLKSDDDTVSIGDFNTPANTLKINTDGSLNINNISAKTKFEILEKAEDTVTTYTFLDAGTSDERISTIVLNSATLSLTATKTYVWSGTSPNFYISTKTHS